MSYTDLRDFTAEYAHDVDGLLTVEVEKLGGGTVGRHYEGVWRYVVTDASGVEIGRGQDYCTGVPRMHNWVARDIAERFTPEA